jgi:hypothetical protein
VDGIIGCAGPLDTCTSNLFVSQAGSDLDTGWNGLAHNQELVAGASITLRGVRRCVNHRTQTCFVDSDCPSEDTCQPFCDCDDPSNSRCEVTGPSVHGRCVRDLKLCTTNADCGASGLCERFFGPPLPLTAANTPACVTSYFAEDITGTEDSKTGEGELTAFLRSRVHLGILNDKPCPRCGALNQNPEVGDTFACDGGPNNGDPCTVEAVSSVFGGVSNDCPPEVTDNISGQGLAIRFLKVTTGQVSKTAKIPCVFSGACTDDGSACTTNADCLRCTNDLTACTTNGECSGGTCAAAPDQPVSCGFYCHCGFCNNDPNLPASTTANVPLDRRARLETAAAARRISPTRVATISLVGAQNRNAAAPPAMRTVSLRHRKQASARPRSSSSARTTPIAARREAARAISERRPCFEHTISRQRHAVAARTSLRG